MRPLLSIIVICHNMRREAPRTLHSLSRHYQQGVDGIEYEVLVVDNGSSEPLDEADVKKFGPQFRYRFHPTSSASPVGAINAAVRDSNGQYVVICIDGARILSPGMLRFMALATRLSERPVISSLIWHLGSKIQKLAMLEGYNQQVEDELLAGSGWEDDGYRLFTISCLGRASENGWFHPVVESCCLAVSRSMFNELGGYEAAFQTPGGGYANIDFYKRACEMESSELITLLGEGTFHQFHGGAATNSRPEEHPAKRFIAEYRQIRGEPYRAAVKQALYLGTLPEPTRIFHNLPLPAPRSRI